MRFANSYADFQSISNGHSYVYAYPDADSPGHSYTYGASYGYTYRHGNAFVHAEFVPRAHRFLGSRSAAGYATRSNSGRVWRGRSGLLRRRI
jgi:hypothetical protein